MIWFPLMWMIQTCNAGEDQLVDVGISLCVLLEGCKELASVHSCMHVSPAIQVAICSTNTSQFLFTVASKP